MSVSVGSRVGRALGLAVAWAIAWAPIALIAGTTLIDPDDSMDEMWVLIGAYPGFICALLFCALLALAERGRRLRDIRLARLAFYGAIAGLVLGVFPLLIGGEPKAGSLDRLGPVVAGSFVTMSALSALATGAVARSRRRHRPGHAPV